MSKAKRKNSSYKTEPKKPMINSRSDRMHYANQKLYDYPLSVTWFRIFKTVITVLQAVMSGYSAIVCVVSVFRHSVKAYRIVQMPPQYPALLHTIS